MSLLTLNKQALEKEITTELEDIIDSRFCEESTFAIAEIKGVQIQLRLTKNEYDFCCDIQDGLASLNADTHKNDFDVDDLQDLDDLDFNLDDE